MNEEMEEMEEEEKTRKKWRKKDEEEGGKHNVLQIGNSTTTISFISTLLK